MSPSPPPPPAPPPAPGPPAPPESSGPPPFGSQWRASVSANVTQPGYDAGLVIVNFTQRCGANPKAQQMKTIYGDFYTVLTRCDLGYEFTIQPASRGSGCTARKIGVDVAERICSACGTQARTHTQLHIKSIRVGNVILSHITHSPCNVNNTA